MHYPIKLIAQSTKYWSHPEQFSFTSLYWREQGKGNKMLAAINLTQTD